MAVADGVSPIFEGNPTALGYKTKGGMMMTKAVSTNGTTEVNVFGTSNGFSGSVVGIKITPTDATAGSVRVHAGTSTGRTLLTEVVKAASYAITGSAVGVSGAFVPSGTLTVVSTTSGNALVEVTFTTTSP